MHQEGRRDEVVTLSLPTGAKVLSWRVLVGSRVKKGSSLCSYETLNEIKTLISPLIGIVDIISVNEGESVSSGNVGVVSIRKHCDHSVVALDLCAFCGLDLRSISSLGDRGIEDHANVSMLHGMPQVKVNKKEAQRLGNLDKERLLKNRKLALIIDLDQTLIHTSIDRNIEQGLPDVYSFSLPGHSCVYHCRLRPYVTEFLNHVSQYYELHVATMGTRDYADAITRILDRERRLFSDRVISRNELFDPHSKAVRLKSVFPCGDEMVAIMDDRGDVWGHRSNLIHVKAYVFFAGTDDINAPPLLPSPPPPPPASAPRPPSRPLQSSSGHAPFTGREDRHDNVSPGNSNANNNTDKGGNGNGKKDDKNNQNNEQESNAASSNTPTSSSSNSCNAPPTSSNVPPTSYNAPPTSSNAPPTSSNVQPTSSSTPVDGSDDCKDSTNNEDDVSISTCTDTVPVLTEGSNEGQDVTGIVSASTREEEREGGGEEEREEGGGEEERRHDLADYNVSSSSSSSTSSSSSDSSSSDDEEEAEPIDVSTPTNERKETQQPQPPPASEPRPPVATETHPAPKAPPVIKDPDRFLLYLQDLLERIHQTFYNEYDQMKGGTPDNEDGVDAFSSPDLKVIIPRLRKSVFSGLRLLFTGVIPTNMDPEKSREWNTARAFGGSIHSTIITSPVDECTTHVVVGKKDTDKYKQALRVPSVKIVTPEWFWDCAERWKRLDESVYRLVEGEEGGRKGGDEQKEESKAKEGTKNDAKKRKGMKGADVRVRTSKGKRKMGAPRQKAKHPTPPTFERKFSVSSAELELMEAEIDAELDTDDDTDDEEEKIGSYIQPLRDEDEEKQNSFNAYLGLEEPSSESSRNYLRKRKRDLDEEEEEGSSESESTSDDSYDELSALLEFT